MYLVLENERKKTIFNILGRPSSIPVRKRDDEFCVNRMDVSEDAGSHFLFGRRSVDGIGAGGHSLVDCSNGSKYTNPICNGWTESNLI